MGLGTGDGDLDVRLPDNEEREYHHQPRRRKSDTGILTQALEAMLQYKALGAICVILCIAAGFAYSDMRARAKIQDERLEQRTNAQLEAAKDYAQKQLDISREYTKLSEQMVNAVTNSTRAVENNTTAVTAIKEDVHQRLKAVEQRMTTVEDAVKASPALSK